MNFLPFKTGILVSALNLLGYDQPPLSPLKVGDRIPDILLENIINYPGGKARFCDFKDKLLILYFRDTLRDADFPVITRFGQLQSQFGKRIQILMVTTQPAGGVARFFARHNINLLSVTGNQKLTKLFPQKQAPCQVWIKNGKVLAITGEAEVNAANIKALLSGELLIKSEKNNTFYYDLTQPLLFNGNGGQTTDLLYHSVFTGYLDGIGGGGVYTDSLNRFKIRALNSTALQLYQAAMRFSGHPELVRSNRCILDFDRQKILPPPDVPAYSVSARDNYYCYELMVPNVLKERAGEYMLEDLNRIFGARYHLRGSIGKRTVNCWALKKTPAFKGLEPQSDISEIVFAQPNLMVYRRQPFSKFYSVLVSLYRHDPLPLIDQTGITAEIDISFPTREKDIRTFSAWLEKYGLCLQQESCRIDMLVINQLA